MRILLFSNARNIQQSSYGKQAGYLCDIWKALGHEVAMLGHPGGAAIDVVHGTLTFPQSSPHFSQDSVAYRAKQWGADIVISLMDLFVLNPGIYRDVRHVCYFPVDTNRLRPTDNEVLKPSWDRLSFSKWGQAKAIEAGHDTGFIPLCVNTDLFQPMNRKAAREALQLPTEGFLFGTVAANKEPWPTRKGWHELFEGFARFLNDNPDADAYLYCHTTPFGTADGGTNLPELGERYGIIKRLRFAQPEIMVDGLPEQALALLYNAFDVFVTASKGEGFCLPLIESQSCGIPVICGEWTALGENAFTGVSIPEKTVIRSFPAEELLEDHDKVVKAAYQKAVAKLTTPAFDAEIPHCTLEPANGPHQEGTYRYAVYPQALADAMTAYYRFTPEEKAFHSQKAREAALQFHPARIAAMWKHQLDKWERRIAEEANTQHHRGRQRPDLNSDFVQSVIRANETEADVVLVCPSYGERCGIAEYTGYQALELYKAGVKAFIATTVAEAIKVAQGCKSVRSVIVHHEYSLFDEGNPRLCMGESLPVVLRQLKSLNSQTLWDAPEEQYDPDTTRYIKVAVIQHTVSRYPAHDGINKILTSSGVPLYATSFAGVNYLAQTYGAKVGHCPLGTWEILGFEPNTSGFMSAQYPNAWRVQIGNFGMLGPQRDLAMCAEVCKATGSRYYGSHATDHQPYIEQVGKLFDSFGVDYQIDTDWPGDIEVMRRLSVCDILLMPRVSPVFYSSASIISAMNARRPIIVNNDPGYADLADIICIANTTEEAVAWVERLRNPAEYAKAVAKIEDYLKRRNVAGVLREAGLV